MDHTIFRWINDLAVHTSWANGVVSFYANAGIVVFAVLLVIAYLDTRRHDDRVGLATTMWAGAAALVALGCGQLIGQAVDRARPYATLSNVHVLIGKTTDFSFPSDHATAAGAVAAGLLLVRGPWGRLAAVAAVLMAFARVYAGAHYPGDVLAGLALGAIVAVIGRLLVVPMLRRVIDRLATTPAARLVTSAV
jgi:membrane-associated phospholipid phosphatase